MMINHRTTQLGVVNQKRPEVWQSQLPPRLIDEDRSSVSLAISNDQYLKTAIHDTTIDNTSSVVSLQVVNSKLIDPTKVNNAEEDIVSVSLAVNETKLYDIFKAAETTENIASINLSLGDQKLYHWGLFAELTEEDHSKISLAIGDHKLYEE